MSAEPASQSDYLQQKDDSINATPKNSTKPVGGVAPNLPVNKVRRRNVSLLDVELRANSEDETIFKGNDFQASKEPRRYSEEEKQLMKSYESVDTFEPQNTLYKDHLVRRSREPRGFIWVFVAIIGICSGITAVIVVTCNHILFATKLKLLAIGMNGFKAAGDGDDTSVIQGQDAALNGVSEHNYFGAYIMWLLFSLVCSALSSLISYFIPETIGVGTPEVTAYLNGIENTDMFKVKVFFGKLASGILSMASGLPVGHFGTIIQSCTMIASFLISRSHFARFRNFAVVDAFRNPRDRRIITVVGAAAGVSSAFSVSLGGLMFIMEQLSTVFPVKLAVYVFVSCLAAVLTLQTYFSFLAYFRWRDREGYRFGELLSDVLIQFDTKVRDVDTVSMNLFDFIPTIVIGFACGLLSALFIRLNWISLRIRRHIANRMRVRWYRFAEPVLMTFIYVSLTFLVTMSFGKTAATEKYGDECKPVPDSFLANRNVSVISYYGLVAEMCEPLPGKQKVYQPFGSLSMGFADSTVQMLLSTRTDGAFSPQSLIVFFLIYFIFSSVTFGLSLSGDVLLPLMVLGGTLGRIIGIATHEIAVHIVKDSQQWADPGVFALIGAAAFLGGSTGLTFSICTIMVEVTNDFRHVLCVMLAISIAKKVSETFAHSIGNSYLEAKCVPLLDFAQQVEKYDMFCARHVMATPVTKMRTSESILGLVEILANTQHNAFPVESIVDNTFKGLLHRSQLTLVLWHAHFHNTTSPCTYDDLKIIEDRLFYEKFTEMLPPFSEEMREWTLDLNPYIDTSAYCVQENTAMSRAYNLFKSLGLRQLVVINRENKISGVITRKDLMSDNIMERIVAENKRRRVARRRQQKRESELPADGPDAAHRRITDWLVEEDEDEDESVVQSMEFSRAGALHPVGSPGAEFSEPGSKANMDQNEMVKHILRNNSELLTASFTTETPDIPSFSVQEEAMRERSETSASLIAADGSPPASPTQPTAGRRESRSADAFSPPRRAAGSVTEKPPAETSSTEERE